MKDIEEIRQLDFTKDCSFLPQKAGIYFILDASKVLYIGKATNLYKRGQSYRHYFFLNNDITIYYLTHDTKGLSSYEKKLIKRFKPLLNIAMTSEPKIPLYPAVQFRTRRDLYKLILNYCSENNVTISDKSRELWQKEIDSGRKR